jgi:hypothetical protein
VADQDGKTAGVVTFDVLQRTVQPSASMVKTCNQCGKTVGTPGAVGFVRTGLPAAIVAGLLVGLLARLSSWFMLAALPIWLLFGWLFWEAPRWLAAFCNRFRRCPCCGERNWDRPHYGGFGS